MYQQPTAEDFSALPLEELERRINEFNKSRDEIIENMRRNKRKLVESGEMTTEEYVKRCRLDEMPLYLNQEDMNAYSIFLWKKSGEEKEEPELLKLMEEDEKRAVRGRRRALGRDGPPANVPTILPYARASFRLPPNILPIYNPTQHDTLFLRNGTCYHGASDGDGSKRSSFE
ncbi:unnamed protein product [Caenorhabditis auriculariae]|uniref:Uncharacterized protein n=1 Tax=Caenorhabditis auriculariae TaxID=2777116 RepID=A0A8S1HXS8_9PELO|nr:unnamed protein product [Caenorhabditis auriculariae]